METQIETKLAAIQSKLNAPKNQRNEFGKYNYRSAEDILEAVKPLLKEQGCVLVVSDEIALIGNRFYVKATATLSTGPHEQVSATAFAREEESKKGMDAAQLTGATSSYARKYALNGLFAIDDNKDADATNTHGKEPSAGRKFTAEEAAAAERWADGLDKRAFVATLAEMKIQSLLELDYSRKAEFMRLCKENAAELKKLDAAQQEGGEK